MANRIKHFLDKRGMTQKELADRVGVTEVSMSRYINGDRTPKGPIAVKIARELNADITDVLDIDFEDDQIMAMPVNPPAVEPVDDGSVYIAIGKRVDGTVLFWHYDTPTTLGFNTWSLLKSFPDATIEIREATAEEREKYERGE